MSTASRPYHHGDLRTALVEEALAMARADGPGGVSLREATRRAGVTPPAAYRHFRGRAHLLDAVARQIQDRMAQRMRRRMRTLRGTSEQERALQRLRGVGLGYIAFAVDEPGWFETAFFGPLREDAPAAGEVVRAADRPGPGPAVDAAGPALGGVTPGAPGAEAAQPPLPPPFRLLIEALDECVQAGVLPAERRPGAEFVCWSAVHGCAELMLHGPLRDAESAIVQQVAQRVVDDIITGIR